MKLRWPKNRSLYDTVFEKYCNFSILFCKAVTNVEFPFDLQGKLSIIEGPVTLLWLFFADIRLRVITNFSWDKTDLITLDKSVRKLKRAREIRGTSIEWSTILLLRVSFVRSFFLADMRLSLRLTRRKIYHLPKLTSNNRVLLTVLMRDGVN